ncbi:MAG: exo-poly-alpha-D-galacturonosidase [Candidatus Hydrogenedentota bacterium]
MATMLCLLAISVWRESNAQVTPPFTPSPGEFLSHVPYDLYIDFDDDTLHDKVYDIRDFGAVGDGKSINTTAINDAILAAHRAGGGTVSVAGGDFVSGTVLLKSNVTLHIAKNAVLRASQDRAHYDPMHFIYCEDSHNVRIKGPGRIAGDGHSWWQPPRAHPPVTPPEPFNLSETMRMHGHAKRKKKEYRISPLIRFQESADIRLDNLIIENSPGWTLLLHLCDRVNVENVVINNNYHGENTDGIDIVASSNVLVSHCFISTGDDGIVLKNGFNGDKSRPMENVQVRDCAIRSAANGIKIGTETWADISNVHISDCELFTEEVWPWSLSAVAIESVDGAHVSKVTVKGIKARNVMTPLFIRLGNRNRWDTKNRMGKLEDITVSDVTAYNVESPAIVSGIPGLLIRNVRLENFDVSYREAPEVLNIQSPIPELEDGYPEFNNFGDLPAYALFARHVDGLVVRSFRVVPRSVNQRVPIALDDVRNPDLDTE